MPNEHLRIQIVTGKRGEVDVVEDCFVLDVNGTRLGRLPIKSYSTHAAAQEPEETTITLYGYRTELLRRGT